MQINGKRVLITGASSGIGRALAWEFARRGAILSLAARRESRLREVSAELRSAYPDISAPIVIKCDVSDRQSVRMMTEQCISFHGGIDVLVNNAGISIYGDTARTPMEDCRGVMDVNYFGALNCIIEVLPHMKKTGQGLIVNIASVAAIHGVPYLGAYGASKAALVAYSQSLRAELKDTGISVMNVYPNYTRTAIFDHEKKIGGARRPQGPYTSSAEVARKIVRAVTRDRPDLILSTQGKALFMLQGLWPSLVERAMGQIADRLREDKENSHA